MKKVLKKIFKIPITVENSTYKIPITASRMAIWERYIPYIDRNDLFGEVEDLLGKNLQNYIREETLSSKIRMESLYNNLSNIISYKTEKNINTLNCVECGTGVSFRSFKIISKLMVNSNIKDLRLEAYDTFEGLPFSKDNPDPSLLGIYKNSLENFEKEFGHYHFVKPYKGLIPNTFPKESNIKYDFIHLDLDLYEGTIASLEYFFGKLNSRGIIQLDDYNTIPWRGVNKALNEFLSKTDSKYYIFNKLTLGGAYIIKV